MIIESYADPGNDSTIILWSSLITACVIGVIIAIIYLGCAVRHGTRKSSRNPHYFKISLTVAHKQETKN